MLAFSHQHSKIELCVFASFSAKALTRDSGGSRGPTKREVIENSILWPRRGQLLPYSSLALLRGKSA
jgi:hypothetical protein